MRDAHPQPWDRVDELAEYCPGPMVDLIRHIGEAGFGRTLHGYMRHSTLYIAAGERPDPVRRPCLEVEYYLEEGQFRFTYLQPARERRNDWTAKYPADQGRPAFHRFLQPVGWFPEGHPFFETRSTKEFGQ